MKKRIFAFMSMVMIFAMVSASAFAEGNSVSTAMTTAFGTIASDAQTLIAAVVPVALPVLGAIVLISIGIRVFKKVTGR